MLRHLTNMLSFPQRVDDLTLTVGGHMSAWYVEKFNAAVPVTAQAALAAAIQTGYREATEYCRLRFQRFGWKRALGASRWFHLEEALLRLRDDFPELDAIQLPNISRSHFFGLARTGDIYFTIAKVADRAAKPPAALFRRALQSPIQLSWLNGWDALPPDGICALLIHGPDFEDPSQPAFARIKFMDGADSYLPEHIDLHKLFIAAPPAIERIEIEKRQLVQPRLRHQERSS